MFADTIAKLPFTGKTPQGAGFFPPMFRASSHVLFLLSCLDDEDVKVTNKDIIDQLQEALTHWDARAKTPATSTVINDKADLVRQAIAEASTEAEGWDDKTRVKNIRDLAQRIAQHAADLDRELVGLRESDPGTSL